MHRRLARFGSGLQATWTIGRVATELAAVAFLGDLSLADVHRPQWEAWLESFGRHAAPSSRCTFRLRVLRFIELWTVVGAAEKEPNCFGRVSDGGTDGDGDSRQAHPTVE